MAYEISAGAVGSGGGYYNNPVFTPEYRNKVIEIKDSTNFNNKENFDINPSSRLNKFDYETFKAGSGNAYQSVTNEFEGTINNINDTVNGYVATAQAAKAAIEAAIAQDAAAKAHAEAAAAAVEPIYNDVPTGETDKDGNPITKSEYDAEATAAARQAEYDRVWEAECWKPA